MARQSRLWPGYMNGKLQSRVVWNFRLRGACPKLGTAEHERSKFKLQLVTRKRSLCDSAVVCAIVGRPGQEWQAMQGRMPGFGVTQVFLALDACQDTWSFWAWAQCQSHSWSHEGQVPLEARSSFAVPVPVSQQRNAEPFWWIWKKQLLTPAQKPKPVKKKKPKQSK